MAKVEKFHTYRIPYEGVMSMKNAVDCTISAGWLTLGLRISLQVYSIITGIFEYQLFSRVRGRRTFHAYPVRIDTHYK
jgi:hypothetical protein